MGSDFRLAALPMYDEAEYAAANDALWARIAAALGATQHLTRGMALPALWTDRRLLLAQTCGWPFATTLVGHVALVATPRYNLPGCDGATHRAFVIVRADEPVTTLAGLRGRRLALNGWDSNTGMNLLRALVAPLAEEGRFFGAIIETGAHRASLRAVADGRADAASVDCVTFGLLRRHAPAAVAGLRVLAETPASPALPFITHGAATPAEIAALRAALAAALPAQDLALTGIEVLPADAYSVLPVMAAESARLGYAALA